MQINRLFEIVYLLMHKKHTTADELADYFEVSKRTILRDLDTLKAAKIPVYTVQGKGGGVFIMDDFALNKALLSEDEQKQILFSLQSMSAVELVDTQQVLGRLRSFFASHNKEWIEVDFSRWGHSEADGKKFDVLKSAITGEHAVSFDYLNPYGEFKGREAYPLKMIFRSKAWYLQSFCLREKDYRIFKFSRMSNVQALSKAFNSEDYDPPSLVAAEEAPLVDSIEIRVLTSQFAKSRIYDEFLEGDIVANSDGSLTLQASSEEWLCDYILSFGDEIEVLEPQCVRDKLLERLEEIRLKYLPKT